jgi:hypothetical protein
VNIDRKTPFRIRGGKALDLDDNFMHSFDGTGQQVGIDQSFHHVSLDNEYACECEAILSFKLR